MKWKPIRRAQGDYEKMMKFMKFHTSDELGNCYEVKDPDLLRMKKQNESLKSALNEANQSVKQIQVRVSHLLPIHIWSNHRPCLKRKLARL